MNLISELNEYGFAHIKYTDPDESTISIASKIGKPIAINGLQLIQTLIPRKQENSPKNIYSGNFGLNAFPLHSDLAHWYIPPKYFLLRCIVPDKSVATLILHKNYVIRDLLNINNGLFKPRRRIDNKIFILKLIQGDIFRWDEIFLTPINQEAMNISKYFTNLKDSKLIVEIKLMKVGEMLIINNWNVLHGRSAIPELDSNRIIERVYLEEINF